MTAREWKNPTLVGNEYIHCLKFKLLTRLEATTEIGRQVK